MKRTILNSNPINKYILIYLLSFLGINAFMDFLHVAFLIKISTYILFLIVGIALFYKRFKAENKQGRKMLLLQLLIVFALFISFEIYFLNLV